MRIRNAVLLVLGIAVTVIVLCAIGVAGSRRGLYVIPAYGGVCIALTLWLGVLYRYRHHAGVSWPSRKVWPLAGFAPIWVTITVYYLPHLPKGSMVVMLSATAAVFAAFVLYGATHLGWDRHPRW